MEAGVATALVLVVHEQRKKAEDDLKVRVRVRLRGRRQHTGLQDKPPTRQTQDKTDTRQNDETKKKRGSPTLVHNIYFILWSQIHPPPPLSLHNFTFLLSQSNFLPNPNVIYVCYYWLS
jgi:hypothetical protein